MAREFDSLIAVLHADVLDAPSSKTPREIAENLGFKRYSTFMNQIEQQEGFKLDANMVLPLMRQTGSKRPLHYLADRLGCVVLDLPNPGHPGLEALSLQAIKAAPRKVGEGAGGLTARPAGDGVVGGCRETPFLPRDKIYEGLCPPSWDVHRISEDAFSMRRGSGPGEGRVGFGPRGLPPPRLRPRGRGRQPARSLARTTTDTRAPAGRFGRHSLPLSVRIPARNFHEGGAWFSSRRGPGLLAQGGILGGPCVLSHRSGKAAGQGVFWRFGRQRAIAGPPRLEGTPQQ